MTSELDTQAEQLEKLINNTPEDQLFSLEAFLHPTEEVPTSKIAISSRFINPVTKQPQLWKLKAVSTKIRNSIMNACSETVFDPKTHQAVKQVDSKKLQLQMVLQSVVFPNLHDVKLQDAFKVQSAEELLEVMLIPGEYDTLTKEVLKLAGYDIPDEKKVTEAFKAIKKD